MLETSEHVINCLSSPLVETVAALSDLERSWLISPEGRPPSHPTESVQETAKRLSRLHQAIWIARQVARKANLALAEEGNHLPGLVSDE